MASGTADEAQVGDDGTRRSSPRRLGILVLALINGLIAVLGLLAAIGVREVQPGSGAAILLEALGDLTVAYAVFSLVGVAIAVGLLRLSRWSWYAAMATTGIGLAWQILLFRAGHQNDLYMLIYVVEAFYLNQRDVKLAFQAEPRLPAPVLLEHDTSGPA